MSTLKSLRIQNHRSHKDTRLDFVPGVNMVIGKSQAGKSDILRAFNLVPTNRPSGFRYHSHFAEDNEPTQVDVELTETPKISYVKTDTIAEYHVEGVKDPFRSGQKVPLEVSKLLNISKVNIQKQLDKPFLITDSPGEVAATINKVIRIEKVEIWKKNLTTKINTNEEQISINTVQLEDDNKKLQSYSVLEDIEKEIVILERMEDRLETIEQEMESIDTALASIASCDNRIVRMKELVRKVKPLIVEAEEFSDSLMTVDDEMDLLNEYLGICRSIKAKEGLRKQIKEAEQTGELLERIMDIRNEHWELVNLISSLEESENQIKSLAKEKKRAEKEFVDLLKDLGKCPVCFSELDEKKIRGMIS